MSNKIKLAIADDHALLRKIMVDTLNGEEGLEVVTDAPNGKELIDQLMSNPVDVIILDLDMPIMSGHTAIVKIKRKYPKVKVLILSMHGSRFFATNLFSKGANAYLPKGGDYNELVNAITHLKDNEYYFTDLVNKQLIERSKLRLHGGYRYLKGEQLSEREIQVLKLICEQLTGKEIANRLHLSIRTIDNHRDHIIKKAGVKNIVGLVEYAVREGYYEMRL